MGKTEKIVGKTEKRKNQEPTLKDLATMIRETMEAVRVLAQRSESLQTQIDAMHQDGVSGKNINSNDDDNDDKDEEKAKLKLVNLVFDTPEEKLPELTETPRLQVTPTAMVETISEFLDAMRDKKRVLLSDIFIRKRDKRMKSIGRKSIMEAIAFSQVEKEELEAERKIEL